MSIKKILLEKIKETLTSINNLDKDILKNMGELKGILN